MPLVPPPARIILYNSSRPSKLWLRFERGGKYIRISISMVTDPRFIHSTLKTREKIAQKRNVSNRSCLIESHAHTPNDQYIVWLVQGFNARANPIFPVFSIARVSTSPEIVMSDLGRHSCWIRAFTFPKLFTRALSDVR